MVLDVVLDNYQGGDTKELSITTRNGYEGVLIKHLTETPENFVLVRCVKSFTIEPETGDLYSVYETTSPLNRQSMALNHVLTYVWDNVDKN